MLSRRRFIAGIAALAAVAALPHPAEATYGPDTRVRRIFGWANRNPRKFKASTSILADMTRDCRGCGLTTRAVNLDDGVTVYFHDATLPRRKGVTIRSSDEAGVTRSLPLPSRTLVVEAVHGDGKDKKCKERYDLRFQIEPALRKSAA